MKPMYWTFAILILIAITSCKKENLFDCIKRTGEQVTVYRERSGFDQIYVEDNVNVYITIDNFFEVKIEAGKNIAPLISTEVHEGMLRIKNNNTCNWARSYKKEIIVYVTMPYATHITSAGGGFIKSLNTITKLTGILDVSTKGSGDIELSINTKKIDTHMHGSGDITLRGTTGEHANHNVGNGFIHCRELTSDYTWIWHDSTGDAFISVNDLLQINIRNSGNIYYSGNPNAIEKKITGKGQLYKQP